MIGKDGAGPFGPGAARAGGGRPPLASGHVAQKQEDATGVECRVGAPTRDGKAVVVQWPGPGRGELRRHSAIRQQRHDPTIRGRVGRDRKARVIGAVDWIALVEVVGAGQRDNFAGGLFLEQQFRGADHLVRVKAFAVDTVHHRIGDGDHRHAVMVRHNIAHHDMALPLRHA